MPVLVQQFLPDFLSTLEKFTCLTPCDILINPLTLQALPSITDNLHSCSPSHDTLANSQRGADSSDISQDSSDYRAGLSLKDSSLVVG